MQRKPGSNKTSSAFLWMLTFGELFQLRKKGDLFLDFSGAFFLMPFSMYSNINTIQS